MARAGSDLSFIIKRLNQLNTRGIRNIVDKYVTKNRRYIMGRIKIRLWTKGESGDGTILPPYNPVYKKYKKSLGQKGSPTTLHFSGDWYDSMFIFQKSQLNNHVLEVHTRGDQGKTNYLKKKYGASILKLNYEEQQDIIDDLELEVQKEVNKVFGEGVYLRLF